MKEEEQLLEEMKRFAVVSQVSEPSSQYCEAEGNGSETRLYDGHIWCS